MNEYPVHLLTRMTEIYSPSGEEREIRRFLVREMDEIGFDVRVDNVGNVIGEVGSGSPAVLLCSHMDTVSGYIPPRIENAKLYGRGAVDAKASLAAMIVATSRLARESFKGRVLIAAVVDEEGSSTGVKHLLEEKMPFDYAIFGEPSGVDNVTIGYRGSLHIKITCRTQTGHPASPWLFDNAIEKSFEIWNLIKKIRLPKERTTSHFHSVSSCITKIDTISPTGMIPPECTIHVDLRIPPRISIQGVLEEIGIIANNYKVENPKVSIGVEALNHTSPVEVDPRSPLVRSLSWAIRRVRKRTPTLLKKSGTSDMNEFAEVMNIPMAAYGPGDSRLDHTPNENIDLKEYLDSIECFYEALKKLPDLHMRNIQASARSH